MTGSEARAAKAAARAEPFTHSLGSETFTFLPEMPLDIVLAYDTLAIQSTRELEVWTVAHLLTDCVCDTSCADGGETYALRQCEAEKGLRARLRGVRVDGRRLTQDDLLDFHRAVLAFYAVTEGESTPSAESPATAGDVSSGTASVTEFHSPTSGGPEAAASAS